MLVSVTLTGGAVSHLDSRPVPPVSFAPERPTVIDLSVAKFEHVSSASVRGVRRVSIGEMLSLPARVSSWQRRDSRFAVGVNLFSPFYPYVQVLTAPVKREQPKPSEA
jgi:hypothetical protein